MTDQPREEQNYKNLYCGLSSSATYILKNSVKNKGQPANNEIFTLKAQKEIKIDLDHVDYCCNDQDFDFLDRYLENNPEFAQKYGNIAINLYELILDRIVKEWKVFQLKLIKKYYKERNNKVTNKYCDICTTTTESHANALLTCNGCNIHVHQDCYGVPNIDKFTDIDRVKHRFYFLDALWFCRKCLFFADKMPKCKYCLSEGGAYKQIYNSKRWAHVLCVHFIDTLSFSNTIFLEPVEELKDDIELQQSVEANKGKKYKKEDYYKTCFICGNVRGRVLKCSHKECDLFYHVSCGINDKLYFDMKNKVSYCSNHDPEKIMTEESIENVISGFSEPERKKRKLLHKTLKYPPEIRARVGLKDTEETFIFKVYHMKPRFTDYVANRIIANDLCYFTDELVTNFLLEIGMFWNIKCNRFFEIQDILSMDKSNIEEWNRNRGVFCVMPFDGSKEFIDSKLEQIQQYKEKGGAGYEEYINNIFNEILYHQRMLLKVREVPIDFIDTILYHLRLIRNLLYKMRSEEEVNFEIYKIDYQLYSMISNFDKHKLLLMLHKLRMTEDFIVFENPVTNEIAPNYSKMISKPKCFKDVEESIYGTDYTKVDFKNDMELIVNNCLTYNVNNDYFLDIAKRLDKEVKELLEKEVDLDSVDCLEMFLALSNNK